MTNERILFRLRVSAECWFFRETCVRPRFVGRSRFVVCSPAGALRSRCFWCRDGWRVLGRTNVAARGQRYVDPLNRCVPRLTRHESFVGVSRGSLLHSCGVWGAEVYNLRPFISAKVEACCPACPTFVVWRFFIRAFVGLIRRRHRLCTCQETYRRQGAGSARLGSK